MFQPGTYFVGDLGFVLPSNALRVLFGQIMARQYDGHIFQNGYRSLAHTDNWNGDSIEKALYWVTLTPHRAGTLFDQTGKPYGFDWFIFGCVHFDSIGTDASYKDNKVEFTEPFTCSSTPETITIGHLHFTLNPPSK